MHNLFFYIPIFYRYYSREKGKFFIPFMMTDFLPSLLIGNIFSASSLIENFFVYTLSFLAMFNVYEIGYILNDCVTVKNEEKPTLRLDENEMVYFENHCLWIFCVRLFIFLVCTVVLFHFYENISIFVLANIALLLVYLLHDYFRNRIKYFTNFGLNVGKYFIPLLLIMNSNYIIYYLILFSFFPLLRCLTYILERKIVRLNMDYFQLVYFFIALVILILIRFFFIPVSLCTIGFCGFFFFYRLVIFFVNKKNNGVR